MALIKRVFKVLKSIWRFEWLLGDDDSITGPFQDFVAILLWGIIALLIGLIRRIVE